MQYDLTNDIELLQKIVLIIKRQSTPFYMKKKEVEIISTSFDYTNFIKKNTLKFHSLIFGIFEIVFNLFLLFFVNNSLLLTKKNNKNNLKNLSQIYSK
jgi:hypothetical protein